MNRPLFFQLPSDNPQALAQFYSTLFGWTTAPLKGMEDLWVLLTGAMDEPGLQGLVMGRHMDSAVNIVVVDDLDARLALVIEHGGQITTSRMDVPGQGSFAWIKDIDGNYLTLMQAGAELGKVLLESVSEGLPLDSAGRPVHFEIPASDMAKSAEFYSRVLGWKAQVWEGGIPYTFLMTGSDPASGIDGAIMPKQGADTVTSNVISTTNIDLYLEKAVHLGAKILMPKEMIPGVGLFAYLQDPDGNLFGLMQFNTQGQQAPAEPQPLDKRVMELYQEIVEGKNEMYELLRTARPFEIQNYQLLRRDGSQTDLLKLFGDHDEMILIHNMGSSCPYCTLWADGFNGILPHLLSRAAFVVSSPDEVSVMNAFATERNWSFEIVSTRASTLKKDLGFELEDGSFYPGISILTKGKEGEIMHHGKTYLGPGDDFCSLWYLFDMLPRQNPDWSPHFHY